MRFFALFLILISSLFALNLSDEEREFISQNPLIRVHNEMNWGPFNYNENGKPVGVSIDYMDLVAKKVGLKVEYISGYSWGQFMEMIRGGELDVMLNIVQNPEREKFLLFTSEYQDAPHGIVVNQNGEKKITSVAEMVRSKVAIEEGFFNHDFLKREHPNTELVLRKDTLGCLQAVSYGEADATFGILPVANYVMQKNGITNLSLIGISGDEKFKPNKLRMAVLKENAILHSILQKGLDAITPVEKAEIYKRHLTASFNQGVDWELIGKILGVFLLVLLVTLFWVLQLKKLQKKLESSNDKLIDLNRRIQESIDYASMIQSALISDDQILDRYFSDNFAIWIPKDTVGGDIYIFEELNENECVLFVIDCTGHGVPGALVTVLVRAIERSILKRFVKKGVEFSPAKMLAGFNKEMKYILKQDSKETTSNVGFDGTIFYYNKATKKVRFVSAYNSVFRFVGSQIDEFKADRHSVGYRTSRLDYEYNEIELDVKDGERFLLSTDGLFDQNGGKKDLPMGKRRVLELFANSHDKPLDQVKTLILKQLDEYLDGKPNVDDISFVAFTI